MKLSSLGGDDMLNRKSCSRVLLMVWIVSLTLLYFDQYSIAYDDVITHPRLTEKAVDKSILDQYLKEKLDVKAGIETQLKQQGYNQADVISRPIIEWLTKGSTIEDAPLCRASNHFHNPLKAWNESFVTDYPAINAVCSGAPWSQRYSNITWATGLLTTDGEPISFPDDYLETPPAPNNWTKARNYYYKALTNSIDGVRETNFAKTFQAAGQVMH